MQYCEAYLISGFYWTLAELLTHPKNIFIFPSQGSRRRKDCSTYSCDWMDYLMYSLNLEFLLCNSWYQGLYECLELNKCKCTFHAQELVFASFFICIFMDDLMYYFEFYIVIYLRTVVSE